VSTLAGLLAELRTEFELAADHRGRPSDEWVLAQLRRIEVVLPQRATDYSGTPLWQHSCQTALAQQGHTRPTLCHNCDETGPWKPLYAGWERS
jgi:hypothetical protein